RHQVLELVPVDLVELVQTEVTILSRLIGEDIELVLDLDEQPEARVLADRGRIEQALMNLVLNARDAMREAGGTLTLRVRRADVGAAVPVGRLEPGRYATVQVVDTGCGIDPDLLGRIFEPFFTTKPRGRGTGLGLSTAYGIVVQSHGHLAVESRPGRGSTFTMYLPLTDEAGPAGSDDHVPPPARGTGLVM